MAEGDSPASGGRDVGRMLRKWALGSSLAIVIPLPIVLGALLGHYLDGKWNTEPLMTVLLFFLGVGAALVEGMRIIRQLTKED